MQDGVKLVKETAKLIKTSEDTRTYSMALSKKTCLYPPHSPFYGGGEDI
jgi:hypothetical protein